MIKFGLHFDSFLKNKFPHENFIAIKYKSVQLGPYFDSPGIGEIWFW